MGSGDDKDDDEDEEDKDGEREDGYEQIDQEDAKNTDDLENSGEPQQVSALMVIVPSQKIIEVMRYTINGDNWKAFVDMPTAGKLETLAALAVTARVAVIGLILWEMAQAFENDVVFVFNK